MRNKQKLFKTMILLMMLSFFMINSIIDPIHVKADSIGTVTATSLNVRKGAGTSFGVVKSNGINVALKKGTEITILKQDKDWYSISAKFNNVTIKGYVLGDYIKIKNITIVSSSISEKDQQKVANLKILGKVSAKLNVRKAAGIKSDQLVVNKKKVALAKGLEVTILGEKIADNSKWYYISFKVDGVSKKGYVVSDYVVLSLKTKVNANINSKTKLKIRTGAGDTKAYLKDSTGSIISLKNGKAVKLLKEVTVSGKKWFQVSFTYSGKTLKGYILGGNMLFKTTIIKSQEVDKPETPVTDGNDNNIILKTGTVKDTNTLNVRVGAGTTNEKLKFGAKNVTLSLGYKVSIIEEIIVEKITWYKIEFEYLGQKLIGYVSGDYIKIDKEDNNDTDNTEIDDNIDNVDKDNTTSDPTNEIPQGVIITDEQFEQNLTKEGFPESYKAYLREIHKIYPFWEFKAYNTGLNWDLVIANQSKIGTNLITNSKAIEWKSLEEGAYNWKKDAFIPFDGSTWVTASKQAIEYYMDPRNFLTPKGIFQFESLSYQSSYQTLVGIENILENTLLYKTKINFIDSITLETINNTYGEIFIKAAEYSGVSPYHLATRVKQEVVTGSSSLSSSVSGKVVGYEGLYNFYNIGATHSTKSGGAVANGLNYAKVGTGNQLNNSLYLIPWDNPFKSIVGGAKFIGSSYIDRGQNTVYLQKFNSTPISTYSHQYMANLEAANAESIKTYEAYSGMMSLPIVFSIPIYNNMPEYTCAIPAKILNPNNWLATLTVDGYGLTPTFNLSMDQTYELIVENSVDSININAAAVSKKAIVIGGGITTLEVGSNTVIITVIAENQQIREYIITIVREG